MTAQGPVIGSERGGLRPSDGRPLTHVPLRRISLSKNSRCRPRRVVPRPGLLRARAALALTLTWTIAGPVGELWTRPSPQVETDDTGTAERVERIVSLLKTRDGERFWSAVSRLEALGTQASVVLRRQLDSDDEKVRLGCAKALLGLSSLPARRAALETLGDLAKTSRDRQVRLDAIQIWSSVDDEIDEVIETYEELLEDELDAQVVISLARTLYELDGSDKARDRLIELLESSDVTVRQNAALALAEIGSDHPTVKTVLRQLRKEPTPRGRRAELLSRLLKLEREVEARLLDGDLVGGESEMRKLLGIKEERIEKLEAQIEQLESGDGGAGPHANTIADRLLEEVIRKVQQNYVREDKVTREKLLMKAIQGMVHSLDDHSIFMEEDEAKGFDEDIGGKYPGIGAQISKPTGKPLELLRPIYGGPADKAGLLSGDRIVEIDGKPTSELRIDGLKDALRGPTGDKVRLLILRRGWEKPREFVLERAFVRLPTVLWEELPEGLGYVRLSQFGRQSYEEFVAALETLEKRGLEGLIIDLRSNPGGLLGVAEKIADLFISGELPIVTQKGRGPDGENEKASYPTAEARKDYPIVVLVNGGSASASEVVAGCLQDYDRATLVGERTFGKGSVQRLIAIRTKPGCTLKLTVQYWHLPLDRCIDTLRDENGRVIREGGVEPDVTARALQLPVWRLEERQALRSRDELLDYVDEHYDTLVELIPWGETSDLTRYPGFDTFFESLDTHALAEDVQQVLRQRVRSRLEDGRRRPFAFDLVEDPQLQHALFEIEKLRGRELEASKELGWVAALVEKAIADEREAEDKPSAAKSVEERGSTEPEAPPPTDETPEKPAEDEDEKEDES